MKNKLILFDWGNIVDCHTTGYTCYDAWNELFKACGCNEIIDAYSSICKYNLGIIPTTYEFEKTYNQMVIEFGFKTSYSEFIDNYMKIFDKVDYYKEVAEYERSLRKRCKIGILSNLTLFDKERLNKQEDLSKFDYVFLSFEMKCQKPDRRIYEMVNKKALLDPKNILFIDDRQDNIDVAKSFGWNTLRATGLEIEKIKNACEEFLK